MRGSDDAASNAAGPAEPGAVTPSPVAPSPVAQWKRVSALIAAALVALLPKCPACWSVYAGLSSLLGVSFVLDLRYLLPLTLASLGVALLSSCSTARRSGYVPLVVAVPSALGIWVGKFVLPNDAVLYVSACGLVLAALAARRLRSRPAALPSKLPQHAQAG